MWLPSGLTVYVTVSPSKGSKRANAIRPFGPETFACAGPPTTTNTIAAVAIATRAVLRSGRIRRGNRRRASFVVRETVATSLAQYPRAATASSEKQVAQTLPPRREKYKSAGA